MLNITGIDPDKVKRYGKTFLKLIREAQQGYEDMMHDHEDRPQDPNHMNVINISSGDEYDEGNAGDLDDLESDEASQQERSAYFRAAPEVEAFNARCVSRCP